MRVVDKRHGRCCPVCVQVEPCALQQRPHNPPQRPRLLVSRPESDPRSRFLHGRVCLLCCSQTRPSATALVHASLSLSPTRATACADAPFVAATNAQPYYKTKKGVACPKGQGITSKEECARASQLVFGSNIVRHTSANGWSTCFRVQCWCSGARGARVAWSIVCDVPCRCGQEAIVVCFLDPRPCTSPGAPRFLGVRLAYNNGRHRRWCALIE